MDSHQCLSVILEKVIESMHSFEENESLVHLTNTLCRLSPVVLKQSVPCSVLKDMLLILNTFRAKGLVDPLLYKSFTNCVNNFYQREKLCLRSKLTIISCFPAAAEIEMLTLLNVCSDVKDVSNLNLIKNAVLDSCLPQACFENPNILRKVLCILKKSCCLTAGNPAVGYLTFHLVKTVLNSCMPCVDVCLLPDDFCYIESLFLLPKEFFCEKQEIMLVEKITHLFTDAIHMNLCSRDDIIFLTTVFLSWYHKILTLCNSCRSADGIKFLKLIWAKGEFYDAEVLKTCIENVLGNDMWNFALTEESCN